MKKKLLLLVASVAALACIGSVYARTSALSAEETPSYPVYVSSVPENDSEKVDPGIRTFYITFDQAIDTEVTKANIACSKDFGNEVIIQSENLEISADESKQGFTYAFTRTGSTVIPGEAQLYLFVYPITGLNGTKNPVKLALSYLTTASSGGGDPETPAEANLGMTFNPTDKAVVEPTSTFAIELILKDKVDYAFAGKDGEDYFAATSTTQVAKLYEEGNNTAVASGKLTATSPDNFNVTGFNCVFDYQLSAGKSYQVIIPENTILTFDDNTLPLALNKEIVLNYTTSNDNPVDSEETCFVVEDFDYAVGKLNDAQMWSEYPDMFNIEQEESIQVVEESLSYPGYADAKGKAIQLNGKGAASLIELGNVTVSPLYAGMLVNVKSIGTKQECIFYFQDIDRSTANGLGRIFAQGDGNGKIRFGISQKGIGVDYIGWTDDGEYTYDVNKTYLLVSRFDQTDLTGSLYVNPEITTEEPATPSAEAPSTMSETTWNAMINAAVINPGYKNNVNATLDAVRVANSWNKVLTTTAIEYKPLIIVPNSQYLGMFQIGESKPIVTTITVKAQHLTGDISISGREIGKYFTLNTLKIDKEAAMSPEGFELLITLNPADENMTGMTLAFTSPGVEKVATCALSWALKEGVPKYTTKNLEDVVNVAKKYGAETDFLITGPVTITDMGELFEERDEFGEVVNKWYVDMKISDEDGNKLTFTDKAILFNDAKVGEVYANLRIGARPLPVIADPPVFYPYWKSLDSPNLKIYTGEEDGFVNNLNLEIVPANNAKIEAGNSLKVTLTFPNPEEYFGHYILEDGSFIANPGESEKTLAFLYENDGAEAVASSKLTNESKDNWNIDNVTATFNYALKEGASYKVVILANAVGYGADNGMGLGLGEANQEIVLNYTVTGSNAGIASDGTQRFVHDDFDYEIGKLNDNPVWYNHASFFNKNLTEFIQVTESSLAYEGYAAEVGKAIAIKGEGTGSLAALGNHSATPLYASMLVNVKGTGNNKSECIFFYQDEDRTSGNGFGRIFVQGNGEGKIRFGISQKGIGEGYMEWTDEGEYMYDLNTTYLLVSRFDQTDLSGKLYVNPVISEEEPATPTVVAPEVMTETTWERLLNAAVINPGEKKSIDAVIDGVRIGESWNSVMCTMNFENKPLILVPAAQYLGMFRFNETEPVVTHITVKGQFLTNDIRISAREIGKYFTLNTTTIPKEAAMSAEGFDLVVTLNPADDNLNGMALAFTSEGVEKAAICNLSWAFKEAIPWFTVKNLYDVANVKTVFGDECNFTVTGPITIEEKGILFEEKDREGVITATWYVDMKISDPDGNKLTITDNQQLFNDAEVGETYVNLRIGARPLPIESEEVPTPFYPWWKTLQSPSLKLYTGEEEFVNNLNLNIQPENNSVISPSESFVVVMTFPEPNDLSGHFWMDKDDFVIGTGESDKEMAFLYEEGVEEPVAKSKLNNNSKNYWDIDNVSATFNYTFKKNTAYKVIIPENSIGIGADNGQGLGLGVANEELVINYKTDDLTAIDEITIEKLQGEITIFNIHGVVVKTINGKLDLEDLARGVYVVTIKNGPTFKVVK